LGGRTRTRKEAKAREIGYGSSGRESSEGRLQWARAAWNKAAKRRGVTANGGLRKGFVRAASAARTVERGKNPEDGTGGGLAILTRHGTIFTDLRRKEKLDDRSPRGRKGHPAYNARGSKNPRRGDPDFTDRGPAA